MIVLIANGTQGESPCSYCRWCLQKQNAYNFQIEEPKSNKVTDTKTNRKNNVGKKNRGRSLL